MGKGINVELTARQTEISDFIARQYFATGTGVGYREICKQFGFEKDGKPYPNAAKTHVDALLKKGAIVASFEENEDGTKTVKANSLRPANVSVNGNCRMGENYCLNVMADCVAVMFFEGMRIVKSDILSIENALKYADNLKIPAGNNIDRIEAAAAKMAAKAVAK